MCKWMGWVGLIAMEVSGKKNKSEISVTSTEMQKSMCIYVCIGEGEMLIAVTRLGSWQDKSVESIRGRWGQRLPNGKWLQRKAQS